MKIETLEQDIAKPLRTIFLIILFAWIALFPQPVQEIYWLYIKIFSVLFLLVLTLGKKYLRRLFSIQDLPLWLFLLCLLSGIACATNKNTAFKTYLYLVTTLLSLFYIGKALFRFEEDRELVCIVISACCAIVAVIGIVQLFFAESIFYRYFISEVHYNHKELRLQSTQYNPIALGSFLLASLPFNFYFLRARSLYRRIWGISCSLLCVTVIVLTFSKAAFLGLIAAVSFWLWKKGRKKILVLLLGLLVLFVTIFSFQKSVNFNRLGSNGVLLTTGKDNYRFRLVTMSLKMFRDYPFFGVGFNHFRIKFMEYYDKAKKPPLYKFRVPDNMYLTLLSETGIVGTFGFFVFIFFLFRRGVSNFNRLKYENNGHMPLIALTALAGLLVNMAAYELFYWNSPYMVFCLICGFIQGTMVDKS
jgi:O-antigen ligase